MASRVTPAIPGSGYDLQHETTSTLMSMCHRATLSARTCDGSICSRVTVFAPGACSLPAFAALTQLRSVCSTNPRSRATARTVSPDLTRFTASSLNSAMYACFGILNTAYRLQERHQHTDPCLGRDHAVHAAASLAGAVRRHRG